MSINKTQNDTSYNEYLDKYVNSKDFEWIQTNIDSFCVTLGEEFDNIVLEKIKVVFLNEKEVSVLCVIYMTKITWFL